MPPVHQPISAPSDGGHHPHIVTPKDQTIFYSLINRTTNFTVNQTEFDGYEGEWYLADADNNNYAKPGTGPVFTVSAPRINLTIRDPFRIGGTDVSGMSILRGEGLQFQIGTNMYTVLANPSLRSPIYNTTGSGANSDGFLDIIVKDEHGITITNLYDDNNLERTLIALNLTTQPYTWGMSDAGSGTDVDYMWSTLAYPQGTYTVSVRSKLNNMYE